MQEGQEIHQAAQRLGICIDTLKAWVRAQSTAPADVSAREKQKTVKALQTEIRALKKEHQKQAVIINALRQHRTIRRRR